MMYECVECGAIFDDREAGEIVEKHEFWGSLCCESIMACPVCKSDWLEEYDDDEQE